MGEFFRTRRFKFLLAILIVLSVFMLRALYTGGLAPLASQIVSIVSQPFQKASASISGRALEFAGQFVNAKNIARENEELKRENQQLREQLVDYQKVKHENNQFREFLEIKERRTDLLFEPASVIARDPNDRFYSFTIDRGTADGVGLHQPVITADGLVLVGYVSEVGLTYAKVLTILDVSVDVGAYDSRTRDIGIVTGGIALAEKGLCQLTYLPRDSGAARGDIILTSGGSIFPKDLMIGQITEVSTNSQGTSLVATVKPIADIPKLKDVFVITQFEPPEENQ